MSANTFAEKNHYKNCPTLTADEVKFVIQQGRIEHVSDSNIDFYTMAAVKNVKNVPYMIYVGNILAGNETEARDRANNIVFAPEKEFMVLPQPNSICWYKLINVSDDETIMLVAFNAKDESEASKEEQDNFKKIPVIPSDTKTSL